MHVMRNVNNTLHFV